MSAIREAIIKPFGNVNNTLLLLAKHLSRLPTLEPTTKGGTSV